MTSNRINKMSAAETAIGASCLYSPQKIGLPAAPPTDAEKIAKLEGQVAEQTQKIAELERTLQDTKNEADAAYAGASEIAHSLPKGRFSDVGKKVTYQGDEYEITAYDDRTDTYSLDRSFQLISDAKTYVDMGDLTTICDPYNLESNCSLTTSVLKDGYSRLWQGMKQVGQSITPWTDLTGVEAGAFTLIND